jgi:cob(I)alamin adenosyltransferase
MDGFKQKESVTLVYTGDGKGKTSASLGLMARALGSGWSVAFIQFIKYWEVSEHHFIKDIGPLYENKLFFYKGGRGFYNAGELSQKNVSEKQHKEAASTTYQKALECAKSGKYNLV